MPSTHRTDRLSAAYRNLCKNDDAAAGYQAFCDHYSLEPTRNNPGVSHENGSVEAAHGHLKAGLREVLALRGSRDFASIAAYQAFLVEFVRAKNARRRPELQLELKAMRPLPRFRTTDFSIATVMVTRSGTISIRGVLYTLPSRLVGCRLKVHIYDDRLSCWLGTTQVLELPRRHRLPRGTRRVHVVDYRHLVGSLIRKPQAFRRSVFRDELFPRCSGEPGKYWTTGSSRVPPAGSMSVCCTWRRRMPARRCWPITWRACWPAASSRRSRSPGWRWRRRRRSFPASSCRRGSGRL